MRARCLSGGPPGLSGCGSYLFREKMPEPDRRQTSGWAHLHAGLQFAATVALCSGLGWLVDRHQGWTPWATVVGGMVGVAVATYNLLRETL